ncbi:MAG: hypothetical protein ACI4P8_04085 [Akkermansia sp.]
MKVLGLFFRFICSLIVLLYVALYLKTGTPVVDLQTYQADDLHAWLVSTCTSPNWVTVTAGIILILTLLRIMNLVWNVAFNLAVLAFLLLFFCASPGKEALLLPAGLSANPYVQPLLQLPFEYPAATVIVFLVFILGWIGSNAAIRIAITATVCFGLWYGLTALADCVISPWAQGPEPASAGVTMALAHPWLPAAILGTFFLIFSVLMSVFETFSFTRRKEKAAATQASTQTPPAESAAATPTEKEPADKPAQEKSKPIVIKKPLIQPKPAAAKKAAEPAPKPAEDKPAKPAPTAPKPAEDKPAEPAPTAPKPAEDKPAEPAPTAPKPAEDKPAEPAPTAPKPAEETPAEA